MYLQIKVAEVDSTNPGKWLRQIKSLIGQDIKQEWYNQSLDEQRNTQALANKINNFFVSITEHFSPLTQAGPPSFVPQELFVSRDEVYRSLSMLNTAKAVGLDNIPNKLLKDFALELAPVIQDIYNQTLEEEHIPALLKSIVTPILKVAPPRETESDLHPISLTCTLAKVMEGFACNRLLPKVDGKINIRQYARKGHSTTDALLYMLQSIYEATDSGDDGARIFYADFKGFDLVDNNILMTELQQCRVPQGMKLGVILFSVVTNKLLSDWKLHIKFVDDTSAIEILPRNCISLLNSAATDIHQFAIDHNMRLNPPKCKEMLINFRHYSNFSL